MAGSGNVEEEVEHLRAENDQLRRALRGVVAVATSVLGELGVEGTDSAPSSRIEPGV